MDCKEYLVCLRMQEFKYRWEDIMLMLLFFPKYLLVKKRRLSDEADILDVAFVSMKLNGKIAG